MTIYKTNKENELEMTNIDNDDACGVLETFVGGYCIAITGSRNFFDYALMKKTLDVIVTKNVTLVSGGAMGADANAEKYAREHGIKIVVIKADWAEHGASAGFRRNKDIVAEADKVIAFWDGKSRGTANTIDLARAANIPVFIVNF